mgnify:CR=1 FL=1
MINRKNYRNFEKNESNFIKELFAKFMDEKSGEAFKKAGQVRCTEWGRQSKLARTAKCKSY